MIYCGLNKPPKNKRRGTPEECVKAKQVRYYGVEAIPKDIIEGKETLDETKEQKELLHLQFQVKPLIEKIKTAKIPLEFPDKYTKKEIKAAENLVAKLRKQAADLHKKIKIQRERVEQARKLNKKEDKKVIKTKKVKKVLPILTKKQKEIMELAKEAKRLFNSIRFAEFQLARLKISPKQRKEAEKIIKKLKEREKRILKKINPK